jgi:hypothetical protein
MGLKGGVATPDNKYVFKRATRMQINARMRLYGGWKDTRARAVSQPHSDSADGMP